MAKRKAGRAPVVGEYTSTDGGFLGTGFMAGTEFDEDAYKRDKGAWLQQNTVDEANIQSDLSKNMKASVAVAPKKATDTKTSLDKASTFKSLSNSLSDKLKIKTGVQA